MLVCGWSGGHDDDGDREVLVRAEEEVAGTEAGMKTSYDETPSRVADGGVGELAIGGRWRRHCGCQVKVGLDLDLR